MNTVHSDKYRFELWRTFSKCLWTKVTSKIVPFDNGSNWSSLKTNLSHQVTPKPMTRRNHFKTLCNDSSLLYGNSSKQLISWIQLTRKPWERLCCTLLIVIVRRQQACSQRQWTEKEGCPITLTFWTMSSLFACSRQGLVPPANHEKFPDGFGEKMLE